MTSATGVLLGSVTHKVIRYAHCNVLVARVGKPGGIVAGTDFSDPALPAIAAAVEESRRTGKPLTVVHSVDLPLPAVTHASFGMPPYVLSDEDYSVMNRAARERLLQALSGFDAPGEATVTTGPASDALISVVEQMNADMLVVGTVGRTGFGRVLLGNVAERVAGEAPCSVLITRLQRGEESR